MFDPDALFANSLPGTRPVPDYDVLALRDMRDHAALTHQPLWYHTSSPPNTDAAVKVMCDKFKRAEDIDAAGVALDELGHRSSATANGVLIVRLLADEKRDPKETRLLETYRRVGKSLAAAPTSPAPRLLRTLSYKPAPGEFAPSAYTALGALCDQEYFYAALYAGRGKFNNDATVSPALKILLHQLNRNIMTRSLQHAAPKLTDAQLVDACFLISTSDYSCFPLTTSLAKTLLAAYIKTVEDRVHEATRDTVYISRIGSGVLPAPSLNDSFYLGRKASDRQDISVRQLFTHVGLAPQDIIKHVGGVLKGGTPFTPLVVSGGAGAQTVLEAVQDMEARKLAIFRHQTVEQMVRDQCVDAYKTLLSTTQLRRPGSKGELVREQWWRMSAYIVNAIYGYVGDQIVGRFMDRFLLSTWKYIRPGSQGDPTLMFLRYNARFEFIEDLMTLAHLHKPLMTLGAEERPYLYQQLLKVFGSIVNANRQALDARDGMAARWAKVYSHPTADAVPKEVYDGIVADFMAGGVFSLDVIMRDKLGFGVKHYHYGNFVTYDPPTSPGVTFIEPRVSLSDPNHAVFLIDPDFYMYILFYRILINLIHLPEYKGNPLAIVTFLVHNYLHLFLSFGFNILHRNITSVSQAKLDASIFSAFSRMVFVRGQGRGPAQLRPPADPSNICHALPRFTKAHRADIIHLSVTSPLACSALAATLFNQVSARHPDYMMTPTTTTRYATALGIHQIRLNIAKSGVPPADPLSGDSATVWIAGETPADPQIISSSGGSAGVSPARGSAVMFPVKFQIRGSLPDGVAAPELFYYWAWAPPRDDRHRTFVMKEGRVDPGTQEYTFSVPARDGCEGVYTLIVGSRALGYTRVAMTARIQWVCVRTGAVYEEVNNALGVAVWQPPGRTPTVARGWYSASSPEPYVSRAPAGLSMIELLSMSWATFSDRICGDARADDFDLYYIFYTYRSALPRFQRVVTDMLRAFIEFMGRRAKCPPRPCEEPDGPDLVQHPMRLFSMLDGGHSLEGGNPLQNPPSAMIRVAPIAALEELDVKGVTPMKGVAPLQNPPSALQGVSPFISPPSTPPQTPPPQQPPKQPREGVKGGSPPLILAPDSPSIRSSAGTTKAAPVTRSSTTPAGSPSVISATPRRGLMTPAPEMSADERVLERTMADCRTDLYQYVQFGDPELLIRVEECLDGLEVLMGVMAKQSNNPPYLQSYRDNVASMRRDILRKRNNPGGQEVIVAT